MAGGPQNEEDSDGDGANYVSELCRSERSKDTRGKQVVGRSDHRHQTRKASRPALISASGGGDEDFSGCRKEMEMDSATRELVTKGIKENRFCRALEDQHISRLVETMEYFAFAQGDTICSQGVAGNHFFVVHDGVLEVSIDGKTTNKLERGQAFGAIALIYNCSRTATVVAQQASGVWGVDGAVFRKVLKEHTQLRYAENRKFLDRVAFFEGLSAGQKAAVSELAIVNEGFEAGARVVSEGEVPRAMYIVKSGELSVMSTGSIDESGKCSGGARTARLCSGDVFGEQALRALHGERRSTSVVADTQCELVCIGIPQLKEVLGEDLVCCLERAFMLSTLRRLRIIKMLSLAQLLGVVEAMEAKTYTAGAPVEADLQLAVVIDGAISGKDGKGNDVKLERGTWHEDAAFSDMLEDVPSSGSGSSGASGLADLCAGPGGARLGTLTKQAFSLALRGLGLDSIRAAGSGSNEDDYVRKALLARKVPVFRTLSAEQVDNLVSQMALQTYAEDTFIFRQGDLGNTFFVVAKGELRVLVDGRLARMLGKGACFGERALLLNEPRSAAVMVVSSSAELWCIDRPAFEQVVTQSMREEMIKRIHLQNTSISLGSLRHVRLIGAGSFGSVRLVEHRGTGVRYALKRVRKSGDEIPQTVQRECELLAEMDHPFVICMVKTFATEKSVYILMELVTGGQLLHHDAVRKEVLNRKQAQFYLGSLALILESLHERGIVYRDLKPENVMLDAQGYLKLVDFGIAKKLDEAQPRTWTMTGTLYYLAPELIRGRGYGCEVDIWALGVVGFELVAGYLPFGDDEEDEHSILSCILDDPLEFPGEYNDSAGKALLRGLLSKHPEARLGTGINGWDDIKGAKFFKAGVTGNLFNNIVGREIVAPFVPEQELYSDEAEMEDWGVTLSDADELDNEPVEEKRQQPQGGSAAAEGAEKDASAGDPSGAQGGSSSMTPESREKKEQQALMHLTTSSLKPMISAETRFDIKPPPKPREGPPCPRPVPLAAATATATATSEAAGAAAGARQPGLPGQPGQPGRAASKLREEVDAARGAQTEARGRDWRTKPSVGSWYTGRPAASFRRTAERPPP